MRRLLSDTTYISASYFVLTLTQLGLQIYLVKATSPVEFGEYTVALSIESLVEAVFIARSGELALRYVGEYWVGGNYAMASAWAKRLTQLDWIINCSLCLLVIGFGFIFSNILNLNPVYLSILSLGIPFQVGYGVYKSIFIAAAKLKEQAVFEIAFSLFQALLGIVSIYFMGIIGFTLSLITATFLKNFLARTITNCWWPTQVKLDSNDSQEIINAKLWQSLGFYSILRNLFINGTNQADILIVNAVQGASSVAIYKVAKTLSSLPVRMIGPLWIALRPKMMQVWYTSRKKQMLKVVAIPSVLILTILALLFIPIKSIADDLILFLYNKNYVVGTVTFLILLIGTWIFGAATAWFNFWIIISEEKLAGVLAYGFLLGSIISTGFLYGQQSIEHMATAVCVSMIVTSILCWFIFLTKLFKEISKPASN